MRARREVKDIQNILLFSTLPMTILPTGMTVLKKEDGGGVDLKGQVAIWNRDFRLDYETVF